MTAEPSGEGPTKVVEVHLLQVPLALRRRALEHADEIAREVQLIISGGGAAAMPELVAVLERMARYRIDVPDSYRELAADMRVQLDEAARAGHESADAHYLVTQSSLDAFAGMDALFERFDDLASSGQLLTLAPPEDIKAFRRWLLGQYLTQFDGQPPVPWPQWVAADGAGGSKG